MAYELWGERREVKTWNGMLVGVAEALYQRHATNFDRVLTLHGRKHPYASRRKEDIQSNPKAVGSSGIYIETHGNSKAVTRRATQLLDLFGHSAEDLRIETHTN